MKKILTIAAFIAIPLSAQVAITNISLNGQTQIGITQLTASADANTIVLTWYTSTKETSSGSCGAENSPDNGVALASRYHQVVVAGLTPSTSYTCTATSGAYSGNITLSTKALPTSTPITGVTMGTVSSYNATATYTMNGDTYYNCVSSDRSTYVELMDTQTGWSGLSINRALTLGKFLSLSPLDARDSGSEVGYGVSGMTAGYSAKSGGIWCQNGLLIEDLSQVDETSTTPQYAYYGSLIVSPDHGATWKNMQGSTWQGGSQLNPISTSMWSAISGPTNFGYVSFVMYGADDGTSGALVADNRVDNANAYVYGIGNVVTAHSTAAWSNGDVFYLLRVPRSKIARLNSADYQYYIGGDGSLDSAWSSSQSAATAIITNTGSLGIPSIQYIPALDRYLLCTWNFPNLYPTGPTNWFFYEAQHPWGPWTLITTMSSVANNYYNPVILQSDALSATFVSTTMRAMFASSGPYNLQYATLTVAH